MNIQLECRVQRDFKVRQQGKFIVSLPEEVLEVCDTETVLEILTKMARLAPMGDDGWGRVYADKAVIDNVEVYDYERL